MSNAPGPSALQTAVIACALVLLAGAGGFLAYQVHARKNGASHNNIHVDPNPIQTPPPEALADDSDAGSATPAAPTPAKIPDVLPDFTLPDPQGKPHTLSSWKGQPLMVNFWATWCEPCRREIPLLNRLHRERASQGLEIVGIAVDFRDAVVKYARDIGIDYPVLIGEQHGLEAVSQFGMDAVFPFTVFADAQGQIVTLKIGELRRDEANLILDRMQDVDQGRLTLAAGREQIATGLRELTEARAHPGAGS